MRKLPDWLSSYIEYTDQTEPARLFREWVGVSTIAACLQRKCYIEWGRYMFYPNLYIVLVAPSGKGRKGTAMRDGGDLLRTLGIDIAADSITKEALIKDFKKATKSTGAQLDNEVPMFHSSLTVHSEEMTVFTKFGNNELIACLTDWFDHAAPTWTYRTKNQGTDEIIGLWLNWIAGTTPELLQTSLSTDAIGIGLTGRILFVFENDARRIVFPEKDAALEANLIADLSNISTMKGRFRPDTDYFNRWIVWYPNQDVPFEDRQLSGYLERRHVHVKKVAMIMSASRDSSMIVTGADFDRALDLIRRTEVNMPKVFSGVGKSDIASIISTMMAIILTRGGSIEEYKLRELMHNDADADVFDRAMRTLTAMKFCTVDYSNGSTIVRVAKERKAEGAR